MLSYDRQHWEQLMETVIKRVGVSQFFDHVVYALEQAGHDQLAYDLKKLAQRWEAAQQMAAAQVREHNEQARGS
jgi:hypothetical protein